MLNSSRQSVGWAAAALAGLTLFLHGAALQTGWRFDDPAHLRFVATYAPWQYFGVREVMLEQSYAHITPWNALFYEMGLPFFGLDARGHHAHLLLVIWATALATWGLLRERAGAVAAWSGAFLFLAMPPTGVMAQLLMTGHYAYGLLFTVLALWCWSRAIERTSMRWAWSAAFFYALACLCKELYVPLPAVFLFWPAAPWRRRWRLLVPVVGVAASYLAFRLWVLGGVGGYARLSDVSGTGWVGLLGLTQKTLGGAVHTTLGAGWAGWSVLALLLLLVGAGWRRGPRPSFMLIGATVVALLLPIMPVLLILGQGGSDGRFLVVVGWTAAIVLAGSVRHAGMWPRCLALGLAMLLLVNQQADTAALKRENRLQQLENEFVLQGAADEHLAPDGYLVLGYLDSLAEARRLLQGQDAPTLVRDEGQLVSLSPAAGRRTWAWSASCDCVRPLESEWDARVANFERGLALGRAMAPAMGVEMALKQEGRRKRLSWRVNGPEGRVFLEVPQFGRWSVPRDGEVPFGLDSTVRLDSTLSVRVVIQASNGGLVRSPLLELPISGSHKVSWHAVDGED